MEPHLERASLLLAQKRYDLAARELRQEIAQNPHNADAFSLLALALASQDGGEREALEPAARGVTLAPHSAFAHYVHSNVLARLDRLKEAEAEAREAVRLDPGEPDFHAGLSGVLYQRKRWADARAAAEEALALDPGHVRATNLRVMALTQLGEREAAGDALEATLAEDPNNALTHANRGWLLLHQGDPRRAQEHFREALRLDPELEWARAGIVEALKARNPLYRLLLRYFLWMSRLSTRAQWGVLLGAYFIAKLVPPLLPFYLVFVFLTWTAEPLSNLLLRLDRFGRLVLSEEEVRASNWTGATLGLAVLLGVAGLLLDDGILVLGALGCGVLVIPVAGSLRLEPGRKRRILVAYTLGLAAVGAAALTLGMAGHPLGGTLGGLYALGCAVYTWGSNFIHSRS